MVFEPTFQQISDDAAELPDLEGGEPEVDATEADGGLDEDAPTADEDQVAVGEGEAAATLAASEVTGNDLPPLGA